MVDPDVHCVCEFDSDGHLLSECDEHRTLRNDLKEALTKLDSLQESKDAIARNYDATLVEFAALQSRLDKLEKEALIDEDKLQDMDRLAMQLRIQLNAAELRLDAIRSWYEREGPEMVEDHSAALRELLATAVERHEHIGFADLQAATCTHKWHDNHALGSMCPNCAAYCKRA